MFIRRLSQPSLRKSLPPVVQCRGTSSHSALVLETLQSLAALSSPLPLPTLVQATDSRRDRQQASPQFSHSLPKASTSDILLGADVPAILKGFSQEKLCGKPFLWLAATCSSSSIFESLCHGKSDFSFMQKLSEKGSLCVSATIA